MARSQPRRAVVVGLAGVVVAVALFFLVLSLTGNDVQVRFGADRFEVGDADSLAKQVDAHGPLLFNDPSGGGRPILVQHLGSDAATGWLAFDAQVHGCAITQALVDTCTSTTYPQDGTGLVHYPTTVDHGRVVVDISPNDPSSTTTTG